MLRLRATLGLRLWLWLWLGRPASQELIEEVPLSGTGGGGGGPASRGLPGLRLRNAPAHEFIPVVGERVVEEAKHGVGLLVWGVAEVGVVGGLDFSSKAGSWLVGWWVRMGLRSAQTTRWMVGCFLGISNGDEGG